MVSNLRSPSEYRVHGIVLSVIAKSLSVFRVSHVVTAELTFGHPRPSIACNRNRFLALKKGRRYYSCPGGSQSSIMGFAIYLCVPPSKIHQISSLNQPSDQKIILSRIKSNQLYSSSHLCNTGKTHNQPCASPTPSFSPPYSPSLSPSLSQRLSPHLQRMSPSSTSNHQATAP